jgi:hypothetical protein
MVSTIKPQHRPAGAGPRRPDTGPTTAAELDRQRSAEAVNVAADLADGGDPRTAERVANGLLDNATILEAEADAIAREFSDTPSDAAPAVDPSQQLSAESVEEAYGILSRMVVSQGAAVVIPNWKITPAETDDMAAAIVQALMIWFPDGMIPPKYMAVLAIAGVGARIAIARRDPNTGELPPRYAPPPRKSAANGAAPPAGVQHIN